MQKDCCEIDICSLMWPGPGQARPVPASGQAVELLSGMWQVPCVHVAKLFICLSVCLSAYYLVQSAPEQPADCFVAAVAIAIAVACDCQ